jgi:hypothetical protein
MHLKMIKTGSFYSLTGLFCFSLPHFAEFCTRNVHFHVQVSIPIFCPVITQHEINFDTRCDKLAVGTLLSGWFGISIG